MKKLTYLTAFVLFVFFNSSNCNGQFYFEGNFKDLDLLKKSTIYVAIDQDAHVNNPEYAKIFKDYWKYSDLEIIEPEEIGSYLKEENYFFTLSVTYESGFNKDKSAALQRFELTLWKPDPTYLKEIKKENDPDMEIDFQQLSYRVGGFLFVFDKSADFKIEDVMKGEYYGNGLQLYTGLGIFKNLIQYSQIELDLLNKDELRKQKLSKQELRKEERKEINNNSKSKILYCNKAEIKKLKTEILYVPTSALVDNSGFTLNSYKKGGKPALKASSIFADYPGKYKVINLNALNEKILNSEEAFYYVTLPYANAINIVNSKTGEIIFKEVKVGCSNMFCPDHLYSLIDYIEGNVE